MPDALYILLTTIFVNNFVTVQFLGLCPFMGASQRLETAIGMGMATTFVLTLACSSSYLVDTYLLIPLQLEYLRIIVFIVVIASLVQLAQIVMRATQPMLHEALGIFVPLITTNCAVLGVALLNTQQHHDFTSSIFLASAQRLDSRCCLSCLPRSERNSKTTTYPNRFKGQQST